MNPPPITQKRGIDVDYRLNINSVVAGFIFSVLTMGFISYQTGIRIGAMPPFLGGYVGIVTILLSPAALIVYISSLGTKINRFTAADLYMFCILFIVGLISMLYLQDTGFAGQSAQSHIFVVFQLFTVFSVVKILPINNKTFKKITESFFILSSIMVFSANLGDTTLSENNNAENILADYQQFAIYYLLITLICISMVKSRKKTLFIYIIGLLVLFYNGARTEFIGWAIGIITIELVKSRHRIWFVLALLMLVIIMAGGVKSLIEQYLPNNRVTILIDNLQQDQSYLERQETIDRAIVTISENPIFGDYARYEPGRYAHNILSIWQDFGIIPFSVFCFSLISAFILCTREIKYKHVNPEFVSFFAILLISIILFMFSKAFSNPLYAVTMAFYARHLMGINNDLGAPKR